MSGYLGSIGFGLPAAIGASVAVRREGPGSNGTVRKVVSISGDGGLGQYLAPSGSHRPVEKYYTPEEFSFWGARAKALGLRAVLAGPLVRSSYQAAALYHNAGN